MILLLNGASSAGKTSIAQALQAVWPGPLLHSGIDHFSTVIPANRIAFDPAPEELAWEGLRWITGLEDGEPVIRVQPGPLGERWIADMKRVVAFMADRGHDVVVDDILTHAEWVRDWVSELANREVWMVGVRCPLGTLLRREVERGRRVRGQARGSFLAAHSHCLYDLEVDTLQWSPLECARQIAARIQAGPPAAAFGEMRRNLASAV